MAPCCPVSKMSHHVRLSSALIVWTDVRNATALRGWVRMPRSMDLGVSRRNITPERSIGLDVIITRAGSYQDSCTRTRMQTPSSARSAAGWGAFPFRIYVVGRVFLSVSSTFSTLYLRRGPSCTCALCGSGAEASPCIAFHCFKAGPSEPAATLLLTARSARWAWVVRSPLRP